MLRSFWPLPVAVRAHRPGSVSTWVSMAQQGFTGRCTRIHSGDQSFRPITTDTAPGSDPLVIEGLFTIPPNSSARIAHIPIATDGTDPAASIVVKLALWYGTVVARGVDRSSSSVYENLFVRLPRRHFNIGAATSSCVKMPGERSSSRDRGSAQACSRRHN